ncbi:hypothetical protein R1flu_028092 [Riccia fluitans]|uniref:Dynein heavy chain n=1 Tax=Riccia fluitans TaxID=41844 RepID=A0ABD1XKP3_9MARC
MYLESIFSAPDIQRQLPNESKAFSAVDKQFKDIMKRTHDRANALQAGTSPGWLETFQKSNETLEKIQKNLEDYLETKRMAFPRFYFLSNDELLEILAQTRNVQAVQPHMSKCFDGIRSLDFGDDPKSVDIYAMISGEGERVGLGKNLKARGNVENWLTAVEQNMVASLRRLAKVAIQDYGKRARPEWTLLHAAQLVVMTSQIYWSKMVEDALNVEGGKNVEALLREALTICIKQLEALSVLVRGELKSLQRKILCALITIDVHARDIVDDMIREKIFKSSEFGWQMQLRYYWDDELEDSIIRQTNAHFIYAFEYLGAQPRLVITPLTDRCYMTLTGALHLKLGGAPAGPAGTGKTETTKDLGKALGIQCVVFNCGENLDFRFMGKFFAGLTQCGAWACFDEFNRIDIEVLSVIAQQLLTIQNALKARLTRFNFEGREIKLLSTCGVFITMNPGYAGRTELPDNLKVLFRPVSMMIPDYALVAEVMLFSEGFANAKVLSRKMVKLYKLSSEQLSQQDHYDFGMRAVKSVLVMAGALKRANPDLVEDVVLIRAFKDSNLPKFLAQDVTLFLAIITDLFPGVEIPPQDFGELKLAIEECMIESGLQIVDAFVIKVIQLFETMNVRFGVMAVGPTGGGKSTCYRLLKDAMTKLRERDHKNVAFQKTHTYVLNPKCIKLGELYGEYNLLTNEWTDGLASTLIRAAVADTTLDKKWIVFDGPVDAIWIESMNTVLDDNCILCLPNGERIKLNPVAMRMLFEVADLAVASPATVSRCGMVYVPPEELGWRPYVKSWLERFPKEIGISLPTACRDYIQGLFHEWMDIGLNFLRKSLLETIPSVNINIVTTLCWYYQGLLQPARGITLREELSDQVTGTLSRIFAFSFVWSVGGNIRHTSIEKFDNFIRKECETLAAYPSGDTCFEYFVNVKEQALTPWEEVIPGFTYTPGSSFFSIMVPTLDTVRLGWLFELNIEIQRPVLFAGVSGGGKSAIVLDMLSKLTDTKNMMAIVLNFSAQTTSAATQEAIESKLEKKGKNRYGGPFGKKIICFVDDVNMPMRESFFAQPPIELLRQFQDFRGFYDRVHLFWKDIADMTIAAACGPPGGGRNEVTARFYRHFSMISVQPPTDITLRTIFGAILSGFLSTFPVECKPYTKPIVDCSIEVFMRMSHELLPTPQKSHYTFNLRDVSKIFQGILMVKPADCSTKKQLRSLWIHECMRVFHDRLINAEDKLYFTTIVLELLKRSMETIETHKEIFEDQIIMFADFLRPGYAAEDRRYEQVTEFSKLPQLFKDYLEDYNMSTPKIMRLVFFNDAIAHTARISRILRQPRGNAMLVGVGGSGKQSLTRFACFLSEYQCFQIELTKGYGNFEFREDLKKIYKVAGIDGKPITFLFTDTQIVNEGFVEDINNLLNSGEVPGLFTADEKDRLCVDIREYALTLGIPLTKDSLYNCFINRARDFIHVVLCMSPVGDPFRSRCRQFPSLINCCTIDWFDEWPEEALLTVSNHFLAASDVGSDETKKTVAKMCVSIHTSVSEMATKFYNELRRKYYITPKSYLDCVNLYVELLNEKRKESLGAEDRFVNGLNKLKETNELIATMKVELGELQPILAEKSEVTNKLLDEVSKETAAAQQVKETVVVEEQQVKEQAAATQLIKDDAQKDLDAAMPALNAAVEALNSLNKSDITEMKSFAKPPALVLLTMEAVCILLAEPVGWDSAKKIMADVAFIKRLMEYNKDGITPQIQKKLQKYINDPQFVPEAVQKQSNAATSMCMWVRAMNVYADVAKVVAPKKAALNQAEAALKQAADTLAGKQKQLAEVEAQVAKLKANLDVVQSDMDKLKAQALLTENRLVRAGKLTSALGDEAVRWKETAAEFAEKRKLLVGDVFLCAVCISYYGAFSGPYRAALVASWIQRFKEENIPVSDDCSLRGILATPVESDANLLRTLESSIRIGNPVLLEDIGDTLDPALEPILQKQVFEKKGRWLIRLGDTDVDYDPRFKLYMTTKLANPHYLPEVCIKVTLVNFTVTMIGLEDQLLGDVVRKERADLEEQNDRLVVSISSDKKQLKDLEDKILRLLKESEGNILDDEVLINTLNNSKLMSGVIQGRVKQAEITEKDIKAAREEYRVVAKRGSILYFIISDLALIDSMYQYSLSYFAQLFNQCIDTSPRSEVLDDRLQILIRYTTEFLYMSVSRGLFEEHKLTFSFLICTSIMKHMEEIDPDDWSFFLLGGADQLPEGARANPDKRLIPDRVWVSICQLEATRPETFRKLTKDITTGWAQWAEYFKSTEPHTFTLPGSWGKSLTPFQRLLVLKVMRGEKLVFGVTSFVITHLGHKFIGSVPLQLEEIFKDTSCVNPVIFILTTGADPSGMLQRFAEKMDRRAGDRLHMISLGQGQGPVAETLIQKSRKSGDWVCLQNCHLASSWMIPMERIIEKFLPEKAETHPDFRLWLTSFPSKDFPVPVLQNGIKLTNEPPKGVRANMLSSYTAITEEFLEGCSKKATWKKLVFGITFFHAVIQERRKFGPLGWNVKYDFNSSDLECALQTLLMFLEEQAEIPWPALLYVTGEINYGGRVTDDLDRRCLMSTLRNFYSSPALQDTYAFTSTGLYKSPPEGPHSSYVEYIKSFPTAEGPDLFGMHENANLTYQRQESNKILNVVASIQPKASTGGAGKNAAETILELAAKLLEGLPQPLKSEEAVDHIPEFGPTGQVNSLLVVLLQESERFNKLVKVMRSTLVELQRAIKGLVVMSADLEAMFNNFIANKVPEVWNAVAYPSLKPLSSWIIDHQKRMEFMRNWIHEGNPLCFWLPGFFFPQGFMTGALQNHARKYQIPIDTLNFGFRVLDYEDAADIKVAPDDGLLISGLYVDGARWDRQRKCLVEPLAGEIYSRLPVVHFIPTVNYKPPVNEYQCPLYKTHVRAGVLTTTGASSNYILNVSLPIDPHTTPDFWVLQGIALLCQNPY